MQTTDNKDRAIVIYHAGMDDVVALQSIGRATFEESFSSDNTLSNMEKYLEEGFSIEKLTHELKNKNSQFYFAMDGEKVIGYLKVNMCDAQTELRDHNTLEIERIYVLKNYQGRKAGRLLCDKAIDIGKTKGVDYIWLGVWEENKKAINFYTSYGFKVFDKHIFMLGDDPQTDIMMKLEPEQYK